MSINKIAVFCNSVPDEILLAAGLVSEKIEDISLNHDISNKYLASNLCSYSKNALDYLSENKENYDGMIFTNTCHAMEVLYEICREIFEDKFVYIIDVPRNRKDNSVNYFYKVLTDFVKSIEAYFKVKISEDDLEKAYLKINEMNKLRTDMDNILSDEKYYVQSVYQQRIQKEYEKMNIQQYRRLYEEILERKKKYKNEVRIMLCGSNLAPLKIADCLEEIGGEIVLYDFTQGSRRYSRTNTYKNIDIIEIISINYLNKPYGTMTSDLKLRAKQVIENIKKYNIQLVFLSVIKFCSDEVFFSALLTKYLAKNNIPYLILNTEYTEKCSGQLLTRVEAMLETMS